MKLESGVVGFNDYAHWSPRERGAYGVKRAVFHVSSAPLGAKPNHNGSPGQDTVLLLHYSMYPLSDAIANHSG